MTEKYTHKKRTTRKLAAEPETSPVPDPEATVAPSSPRTKRPYHRRTPEQLLQYLEEQKQRALEKSAKAIQHIEDARKSILQTPSSRKQRMQWQLKFQAATSRIVPEWDERHFMGAIEMAIQSDPDTLCARGEELLQLHGMNRRGGPKRNG